MELNKLNREQIEYVYEKIMVKAFPVKERKPAAMILRDFDAGRYECLGLFEDNDIEGLAFFFRKEDKLLFDYLAVSEKYRNKGLGSDMLKLIAEFYKDVDCVFGEVEDPACAKNDEDRKLQQRRLEFYLRNGYINTGAKSRLFGVDYIILELDLGKKHSREEIEKIYLETYKWMLPAFMYITRVRIKK